MWRWDLHGRFYTKSLKEKNNLKESVIDVNVVLKRINASGRLARPLRNLWADFLENVVASTCHNTISLHSLLQG
jgi:hypothetical protein